MVQIPEYRSQVAPGAGPQPAAIRPVNPNAFGASVGAAINQVASDELHRRSRTEALSAVAEAQREADNLWYDPKTGGRWQKGRQYFDWAEKSAKPFEQSMGGRLENLSPAARTIAEPMLQSLGLDWQRRIENQAGVAREQYYTADTAGRLDSIAESTRKHASDPLEGVEALRNGLEMGSFTVQEFAANFPEYIEGPISDWTKRKTEDWENDVVAGAIEDALRTGNTSLAAEMREAFGDKLLADTRSKVDASLHTSDTMGKIQGVYDLMDSGIPILVGDDAEEEARALGVAYRSPERQVRARVDEARAAARGLGMAPEDIEKTVAYVERRSRAELESLRATQDETLQSLMDELSEVGGDEVALERLRATDMRFVEQRGRDLLAKYGAQIRGAQSETDENENFLHYLDMARQDPGAFVNVSDTELRATLSSSHAEQILSMQKDRTGWTMTRGQAMSKFLEPLSLNKKETNEFLAAEAALVEQLTSGGKPMNFGEYRQGLERITAQVDGSGWLDDYYVFEKGWEGDIGFSEIPVDVRAEIRDSLAGQVPAGTTDDEIYDLMVNRYVQGIREGLYELPASLQE